MMLIKGLEKFTVSELEGLRRCMTKREARLRQDVLGPVIECINNIDLLLMKKGKKKYDVDAAGRIF